MCFERGNLYRALVLFIVLWAALVIAGGTLNKADAELGSVSGDTAVEIALKMCAVIFTAVAAAATGVVRKLWRRLPAMRAGVSRGLPGGFENRHRPPPHGFALLRRLQIIIV